MGCIILLLPFYVNSFFPQKGRPWNFWSVECFSLTYDVNDLKFRVNKQFFRFLLIGFPMCFPSFSSCFFCNSLSFSDSATMRGVNTNENRNETCIFLYFLLIFHPNFQGVCVGKRVYLKNLKLVFWFWVVRQINFQKQISKKITYLDISHFLNEK